jgi:hypothetical protein
VRKVGLIVALIAVAAAVPGAATSEPTRAVSSSGSWFWGSADHTFTTVKLNVEQGACGLLVSPEMQGIVIQGISGSGVTVNQYSPLPHTGFVGLVITPPVAAGGTVQFTMQTNEALTASTTIAVQIFVQCNGPVAESFDVTQAPPPAPPPPPPPVQPPCKCTRLTTRIVPSSVKLSRLVSGRGFLLDFTLHWQMTCVNKGSGCTGQIEFIPPSGKLGVKVYHSSYDRELVPGDEYYVRCPGDCAGVSDGGKSMALAVFVGKGGKLGPADWSSESIPIKIQPYCITGWGRAGKKLPTVKLRIAFDDAGRIDLKDSKLR